MLVLAGITWKEGLRRRLILAGLLLSLGFVLLYGLGVYYAFRETSGMGPFRALAVYQLLSFGIFICSFLGTMLVVFSAAGMVNGEAESGLLQPVAARPVRRGQIVAGRYLGYGSLFVAYLVVLTGSVLVLTAVFADYSAPNPVGALVYLMLQGLILLSLVSLLSTVLAPVPTGIVVFMMYGLSFIGGVVRQIGLLLDNTTAETVGVAMTYIMPTDSFFRMALSGLAPRGTDRLIESFGPFGIATPPEVWPVVYGILYLAVCVTLAMHIFSRKDL